MLLVPAAAVAALHVGSGEPFATVTEALAAAAPGEVIVVHDAVITEEIVVTGAVSIVAATRTRWESPAAPTQLARVQVEPGADLFVSGFDFRGVGPDWAIEQRGGRLRLRDDAFASFDPAVWLAAGELRVTGCRFSNHFDQSAILVHGGSAEIGWSLFQDNPSAIHAGAVTVGAAGALEVHHSVFVRQGSPGGNGGGALACEGPCTVTDDWFVDTDGGVGAAVSATGPLQMARNLVCRTTSRGAAVWAEEGEIVGNLFVDGVDTAGGSVLATPGPVRVAHNTFVASGSDLAAVWVGTAAATFDQNLVVGSAGARPAAVTGGAAPLGGYNLWFDNAGGDADWPLAPTDLAGADPALGGGSACAWSRGALGAGSAARDAGEPAERDRDGSRADIGATGGPDAR